MFPEIVDDKEFSQGLKETSLNLIQIKAQGRAKELEKIKLPHEIRSAILLTIEDLEQIKLSVEEVEKSLFYMNAKDRSIFEITYCNEVAKSVSKLLIPAAENLYTHLKAFTPDVRQEITNYLRSKIVPYLTESQYFQRIFYKPLGYAGDYQVMRMTYDNDLLGKDLWNKVLHRYYMNDLASQSVRARGKYLREKIKQIALAGDQVRIVSLACGPAYEIKSLLAELPAGTNLIVDLMDQDIEALSQAREDIQPYLVRHSDVEVNYLNKSVRDILKEGMGQGIYDLAYTAGLFDYLADDLSQATAHRMYGALKSGGTLIIGNEGPHFPTIPFMELVFDWHLIYRDEEKLHGLFDQLSGKGTIEKEELGYNLFYITTRP